MIPTCTPLINAQLLCSELGVRSTSSADPRNRCRQDEANTHLSMVLTDQTQKDQHGVVCCGHHGSVIRTLDISRPSRQSPVATSLFGLSWVLSVPV